MSAVEEKRVPKDCAISCSVKKSEQNNGKRSFIVTVDDNGKVEVSSSGQCEPPEGSQPQVKEQSSRRIRNATRKSSRGGKQRLRIAVLEENAGSSDGELANGEEKSSSSNNNDMISIDAQSLETMHDRFVKIYNKNLRGKPSFVVLEDALVRKRVEQTLQGRAICHNHAEQQTSPSDIGAHTGSQTDEFLLQCAMRSSMLKGQSRGCQATDVTAKSPECGACAAKRSSMTAPPLRRLSQMCALQLDKMMRAETVAAKTASTARAKPNTAPHVTISFVPAATQTATTVNAQPQQQPLLLAAAAAAAATAATTTLPRSNCANCCAHIQPAVGQPMPTAPHCQCCQHAADSNYACCLRQQQQQQLLLQQQQQQQMQMLQQHHFAHAQQQHPVAGPTYAHCCSSCCLLRPTMAQTTLGFGHAPAMPSHCSHPLLLPPPQPHEYPMRGWPPQPINSCLCYPMPAVSMSAYDIPHCASCHMQRHSCTACYNDYQQQQHMHHLKKQQKQFVCLGGGNNLNDPRSSSSTPERSSTSEMHVSRGRSRKHRTQEASVLSEHEDSELHTSASQLTVRRVNALGSNEKTAKKMPLHQQQQQPQPSSRNRAGASIPASKVYMARFGRTCLVLKPTTSAMPTRLLTKRISRYTSVMAWPQKMARK
ncbi:uncharacterized protein schuy [Drosophila montana]|uniref:uncharacterized protein schuy n=1 Tax=Drosophila montana TaxID=40370 RepID=UPI00313DF6B6